jgi:chemotaxis protein CheC
MFPISLDPVDRQILEHAVQLGLEHAAEGLSGMIGRQVRLAASRIAILPIANIRDELTPPNDHMLSVHLSLNGEWSAQVMLLFEPRMACAMVDLLLGQPPGTTDELDEMGRSALAEVGNVMGSFFAGTIADLAHTLFVPSTPVLAEGTVESLLEERLSEMAPKFDSVLLIETHISEDDGGVNGYFIVLPDPLEIQRMVAALRSRQ